MVKLPPKKMRFAEAYLRTGNQTKAAIEAGYAEGSARNQGNRLMSNADVRDYIRERLREIEDTEIAKTNEVLRFLTSVMRGEVADQFGLDAQLADRIKAGTELLKRYTAIEEARDNGSREVTITFAGSEESAE